MKIKILTKLFNNILGLSFFLFTVNCYSQIEYGITTGINMSRFNNEFNATNGSYFNTNSIGFKLGGFAEIPLKDKIYFSPKLVFSQIGDRDKDFGEIERRGLDISTIDYKLNYISIPLNVRFFNKLYIEIGPQINLLISDKRESLDLGDVDSNIDLGGNLEIGYKIKDFRVSINAYQGFTNLFEIEENLPLVSNDLNVRNFALSLNFGYIVF
jgi:hypothetical protein